MPNQPYANQGYRKRGRVLGRKQGESDPELVLLALKNVAEAQGGMAQLAEKVKLNRESLYKVLSERGNLELKSLDALLHALGFRLAVMATR